VIHEVLEDLDKISASCCNAGTLFSQASAGFDSVSTEADGGTALCGIKRAKIGVVMNPI
jgi:hypothetical protein